MKPSLVPLVAILLVAKQSASYTIRDDLRDLLRDEGRLDERDSVETGFAVKRSAPATSSGSSCEAPRTDTVTIIKNGKTITATLDPPIIHCGLKEQAVQLQTSQSVFPSFVVLHRCSGMTFGHHNYKCAVSAMEEVTFKVLDGQTWQDVYINAYNHTQCDGSFCSVKPSDCHPVMEKFDGCECQCKSDAMTNCNTATQYMAGCRCVCKPLMCGLYRYQDPATCMCTCSPCLTKICQDAGMVIDQATCSCTAPPQTTAAAAQTTVPAAQTTVPAAQTTVPAAQTTVPAAQTTAAAAAQTTAAAGVSAV